MNRAFKIAYVIAIALLVFGVVKFATPDTSSYKQASDHVYIQDDIENDEVNKAETYIDNLPPVLKAKFTDDDWKVYIAKDIKDKVVGRTVIEDKIVYIRSGFIDQELVHEFYHIYLQEHPFNKDFEELWESEGKAMMEAYFGNDSEYKYSDATEFYCSAAGVVYGMNGYDRLDAAPKTFEYFNNLFSELYKMG